MRQIIINSLYVFVILIVISLIAGISRYFVEQPLLFVDSFNKNKFVDNPATPQEIPAMIAHQWFTRDSALFIDTRTREEFLEQTILGAIKWKDEKAKEMIALCRQNTGKKIIFFCAVGCDHAERATQRMSRLLPQQFYIMFDGWEVWQDAGFPTEPGKEIQYEM